MKATELMIGDWVKWKDKYVQIATISGVVYSFGHIDVELVHCGSGLIERHDLKSVSSIPLTKEILEKNGFELRDGFFYHRIDDKPHHYDFKLKNGWYCLCDFSHNPDTQDPWIKSDRLHSNRKREVASYFDIREYGHVQSSFRIKSVR